MRDSKNLVIGMLCAVVCIMAVAYAAFSTTLTVTTNTTIDSNWCVKIKESSCTATPVTGGATDSVTATVTPEGESLSTNIDMKFTQPGDSATCTIKYGNCGTLNATVGHVVTFDGSKEAATADAQGKIIYTNPDGTIKFTITGADVSKTLNAKTDGNAYGGIETITVIGEFLHIEGGNTNANGSTASLSIVSSAAQANQ